MIKLIASLAALLLSIQSASHAQSQSPKAAAPIVIGETHLFRSSVLGDTRELNIWLPPGYEKGKDRYSVLYLLDGGLDQDFQHIAGLAQLGALSWTYEPLIVVGMETKERRAELTSVPSDPRYVSAFPESGGADRFRRYLQEEVIPFVEAHYRTGERRALMGESLAGYFVMDTFLKRPGLFDDYVAISPSLWWDDRAVARRSPTLLAAQPSSDRRLYIAVANEGGTMQDGVNRVIAALKARAPAGLDWRYADKSDTETHSTIYHGAALEALRWLYAKPPYDYGPTPWFMIEGAAPPPKPEPS